jgi:hypothetical protein
MTAELVRGQNHPVPGGPLEIHVSAATPVVAAITLGDAHGRVVDPAPRDPADGPGRSADPGWLAHPGTPRLPGVEVPRQAAADHRLTVDPGALGGEVHRVHVLLALPASRPGTPAGFGETTAPRLTLAAPDGTAVARCTLTGLGPETALLAVELYRRHGSWRVRAVGQGYAGGLSALLHDQGAPDPAEVAARIHEAASSGTTAGQGERPAASSGPAVPEPAGAGPATPAADAPGSAQPRPAPGIDYRHPRRRRPPGSRDAPAAAAAPATASPSVPGPRPAPAPDVPARQGPAAPVAGDAPGWTMEERLYNQIWGMFEDLARSVAAYRGAEDFAASRHEQELDRLLADPRARGGAAAEAAREEAAARRAGLVDQARAVLDRDLAQLTAEAEVVEPALPPAFAGWGNPAWHAYRVPAERAMAVRLGSLTLPEAPLLDVPLLVRLPLQRGLWIDAEDDRGAAVRTAAAIAVRLLACHPAGGLTVHALDPAGTGVDGLAPLHAAGALALPPPAPGVAGVGEALRRLTERVDLVQMAQRGGAADALPPGFDTADQLLLVNDFPYGFDDRAVHQLRYLADEGPSAGVHLMIVADREDAAAYGPVLDVLWRSLLRLTPLPSDHLADPWVGHAWTYEPSSVPPGSAVLATVLRELAASRPAFGA